MYLKENDRIKHKSSQAYNIALMIDLTFCHPLYANNKQQQLFLHTSLQFQAR